MQTSYSLGKYNLPCGRLRLQEGRAPSGRAGGASLRAGLAPGCRRSAPPPVQCVNVNVNDLSDSTSTVPRDVDALLRHLDMTSSNSHSFI